MKLIKKIEGIILASTIAFSCLITTKPVNALPGYLNGAKQWNGHYYKVVEYKASPEKQEKYCENMKGHLVTITSAKEQEFIEKLIKPYESKYAHFTIGCTDYGHEGVWKWMTGEPFKYSHWDSGEPNNGSWAFKSQEYGQIYVVNGYWDDFYSKIDVSDKDINEAFICEWENELVLSDNQITMSKGQSTFVTYTYTNVNGVPVKAKASWDSSNKSVAKVSSKGKIVAVGTGRCVISCKVNNSIKNVTVIVKPQKVKNYGLLSKTSNSIQLKWSLQSGATGYEIYFYDNDLEEFTLCRTIKGKITSARINGLKKNTTYRFKIRAYYKYGNKKYYGSFGKIIKVRTSK